MTSGVALREILDLPPLKRARVVAGAPGLGRIVRHVNVMEVPDILRWVQADELLLTTAYPLRDDPDALAGLVPALAARGLAGLALKPARYINVVPPAVLAAADRLEFPVIELPPDSSFNEIINAVLTVILNVQAARLQRAAEIHERFTAIVLRGGGLREIAETLAEFIARPVVIVDLTGSVLAAVAGGDRLARPGAPLSVTPLAPGGEHPVEVMACGERVLAQAIQVGQERFGSILVLDPPPTLIGDHGDAIEYAATVAALRQVQARAVAEADRRFQTICLEELIGGQMERGVLIERALAFGWDLAVPRAALIAQFDAVDGRSFAPLAGRGEDRASARRLADAVRVAAGRNAIVWERSTEVAALVAAPAGAARAGTGGSSPNTGVEWLTAAARRIAGEAKRVVPEATISIGLGRSVDDPIDLADSFAQARRALTVGRRTAGPEAIVAYDDLGIDRLLVALPPAELAGFVAATIGPLLEYDERHRTELAETLEAYLAARNGALAARRLFVHYNTLKNRLAQVEEVLGPVLDDPARRMAIAVALRIRRLPSSS